MQITVTRRTEIEVELLRIFGLGSLRPITPALLKKHATTCHVDAVEFGRTPLASCLYATGAKQDDDVKSEISEFGLFYDNGSIQFAVGIFKRPSDQNFCVHIIAPRGKNWQHKITRYAQKITQNLPEVDVYTRYINPQEIASWQPVTEKNFPWIEAAPQEDETTPQRLCNLDGLLDAEGFFTENCGIEKRKQNNQKLRAIKKQNPQYVLRPLESYETAMQIIEVHFASLKNPVGSTADDYRSLVKAAIELKGAPNTFSYIGYLNERPVSVFIVQNGNVYANITLREGNSNLPLYAHTVLFKELLTQGVTAINLGGSENCDLDRFKQKRFGNLSPQQTAWARFSS